MLDEHVDRNITVKSRGGDYFNRINELVSLLEH
jgi:hypothetical protein